jgi:teichuronic acid biosynthesis glycosyltransferase TuaH
VTRDLVVLSLEPWDDVWRRNQYLIDGLLRRDPRLRVLFVEPSNDMLHTVVSGRRLVRGRGLRQAEGYDGRLHLLQPDKVLPRVAGPMADALLRSAVRRSVGSLGMTRPTLWVNDPSWAGLVTATGWPSLYDMTDDWLAADRAERERDRITANEAVLMRECAVVVVCSEGLRQTRVAQRPVELIPNAVDVERYRAPRARPDDLPTGSAVYVGTLHEDRLDVDLVLRTADAAASVNGTVVLVGPIALTSQNAARLREHRAVTLLGARPWTEVPAYLQHASVLIVPHLVDAFTDSLDPIKLYEYLAVGRPIVSSGVAGFRDTARTGLVVSAPSEFADAVARTLRHDVASIVHDDVPDWSIRVGAYADVLAAVGAAPES